MSIWPQGDNVVTLCFHGIGTHRRELEPGEERFWISPENYLAILDVATTHACRVNLTFDDSNASDHEFGLTALIERGISARFFVITDRIGEPGSLSESQMLEMLGAGMAFGTHGVSHRPWPALAASGELSRELVESRDRLQDITARPIDHAAFPNGLYNRAVLTELHRLDFRRVFSVDEGWSKQSAWLRSRYSIINTDTADDIRSLLDSPNITAGKWPVRTTKQVLKRWR